MYKIKRMTIMLLVVVIFSTTTMAGVYPLPSWVDGPTKSAIIQFVQDVTKQGGPDYVRPQERIATFDNDGTLWVEYPMYTQVLFIFDRVKKLAPQHPEWKTKQPFKALLEGDMKTVGASGEKGILDMAMPAKMSLFQRIGQDVGRSAYQIVVDMRKETAFLGELAYRSISLLAHPGQIRWRDLFLLAEKAGANGVGITALLGFLIGLILAFQSAIALKMFGAEIYVADLVVLCMFRELGPLITAFILASRSGSAYAAELGTMKVNEELDALTTCGLDPMRFLIVPKVIALVLVLPLLTMFNNLFSLLGAELVMIGLGYSPMVFWDHVTSAAGLNDLFGGLLKTFVFGFMIGGIGCSRGMQTGKGASAVGDSATKAVVACMVMLVAVDFVFAVVYYILGV